VISVLYVETSGAYYGLEGVDPWDIHRDARKYTGTNPVVAHPPCARWCRFAKAVEARFGYRQGDDGKCFETALFDVRRCGGVLEHPASSSAWKAFGIPRPSTTEWTPCPCGGWTTQVEQGMYGHPARKSTWLYVYGVTPPPMRWGKTPSDRIVARIGGPAITKRNLPRLGAASSKTPVEFREVLLGIARSVK